MADHSGLFHIGACLQGPQQGLRFLFGHDHDHPAFTGQIEGLQAQHAADAADLILHRDLLGIQMDAHIRLAGNLIQDCSDTASGRVPDHMDVRAGLQGRRDAAPERGAVAGHIRFNAVFIPGQQNGAAVPSDIAGHKDGVARLCQCARSVDAFLNQADSGGGDKYAVDLSFSCYFGIARYDADACFRRSLFHGCRDLFQLLHGEALFHYERAGQIEGSGSHAGQVIDRPADGQLADIAARKKGGGYNEPVCGYCDPVPCQGQDSRVIRCQMRVGKMLLKYAVNQLRGLFAARAVGQCYCVTDHL